MEIEQTIRQRFFNTAWHGLQGQGWRKTGPWDTKEIQPTRSDDGLKCAVAHITDSFGTAYGGIPLCDFVNALRLCHDQASSPEDMEAAMRSVAHKYDLSIPGEAFARFMEKVEGNEVTVPVPSQASQAEPHLA